MFDKTPREKFADQIIRLIETSSCEYTDEDLGKYLKVLYRRFKLGFDDYYSDGLVLYH